MKPSELLMQKTIAPSVLAALLLSSCATGPVSTTLAREKLRYRCLDAVQIEVVYAGSADGMQGTADLIWDGNTFPLKQEFSGSGGRYTDGVLMLDAKGDEAFVEKDGEIVLKDCNVMPTP